MFITAGVDNPSYYINDDEQPSTSYDTYHVLPPNIDVSRPISAYYLSQFIIQLTLLFV